LQFTIYERRGGDCEPANGKEWGIDPENPDKKRQMKAHESKCVSIKNDAARQGFTGVAKAQ
jgi:hypothetical protein